MNNSFSHTVAKFPRLHKNRCSFCVWAPERKAMTLHLVVPGGVDAGMAMTKDQYGYFHADMPDIKAGDRYYYMPDGEKSYPDPTSAYQPEGVNAPSQVVDHNAYKWADDTWRGRPLSSLIFYEVHVGAFTPEGTFEAIIPRLDELADLGINALELMPVAQCPGKRNWGYDAVFLYAVQENYGGPDGLKKLVDACHQKGMAVFLDIVYNHVGPEGNILDQFGPYFSDKYHTPWGRAFNFDGAWSDGVKDFIVENALYWAECYHIDGLRLDAVHEIFDRNAVTLWELLQLAITAWEEHSGRRFYLIAESDLNSPRVFSPPSTGGMGFDAQWLDDLHHALYVLLDPKGWVHYKDFGQVAQLAKAYTEGFVHSDEYVGFRKRRHGASSAGLPGSRFIVFIQNHDIAGNRPGGQRLSLLVDLPRLKLAAAAIFLSPYIPMLFMGEEYGEEAPFYFFSDYSAPQITDGLLTSRQNEFAAFDWDEDPLDSQDEAVFNESKLRWHQRKEGQHGILLDWHKQLITLRREFPLLADLRKNNFRADLLGDAALALYRQSPDRTQRLLCLFNFSATAVPVDLPYDIGVTANNFPHDDTAAATNTPHAAAAQEPCWKKLLSSAEENGQVPERLATNAMLVLPPWGVVVYG